MEKRYILSVTVGDGETGICEFTRQLCESEDLEAVKAIYGLLNDCGYSRLMPGECNPEFMAATGLSAWLDLEEWDHEANYLGVIATTNPKAITLANGYLGIKTH